MNVNHPFRQAEILSAFRVLLFLVKILIAVAKTEIKDRGSIF
jgi:hypothetical protein